MSGDEAFIGGKSTLSYSFVDEDAARKRHESFVAAGLSQAAGATSIKKEEIRYGTIKNVVTFLVENHMEAWHCLPESVRDLVLNYPTKFEFLVCDEKVTHITYGDVQLKFCPINKVWKLNTISFIKSTIR